MESNFPLPITVMGSMVALCLLLIFRGLAAAFKSQGKDLDWLLGGLFLLSTGIWASTVVLVLEGVGELGTVVILAPGWGFRIQTILTLTAGNSLVWLLARWVSRAGIGSGPLVLCGSLVLFTHSQNAFDAGMAHGVSTGLGWMSLLPFVVLAIGGVSLALKSPPWPAPMGSYFNLRSPVDYLFLPLMFLVFSPTEWSASLALLLSVMLLVSAVQQGGTPRPLAWLLLPGALFLGLGSYGVGWVSSGAFERLRAPGPLDGTQNGSVLLSSTNPGTEDAHVFRNRLKHLSVDGTVTGTEGKLTLELVNVVDIETVLGALLPPRKLSFHQVLAAPAPLSSLSKPVQRGTLRVRECWDQAGKDCRTLLVAQAAFDHSDIATVSPGFSKDKEPKPIVWIEYTPEGAKQFTVWTEQLVGQQIAIVVDGTSLSAPFLREPIAGGRVQLYLGKKTAVEAAALLAAWSSPPLSGHWTATNRP